MKQDGGDRVVFRAGGSLDERNTYVPRSSDAALLAGLRAMEFCYVLAPRQIGKSSLWARTARALAGEGIEAVTLDLQGMGSREVTLDAWYEALITRVGRALRQAEAAQAVWGRATLPAVERWSAFLREVVLHDPARRVVLCLDEIDWVLSLPFRGDDLFASIRAAFNGRATDPAWRNLTFCLIGVASPDELIDDPGRTPFNVGQGIALEDFSRDEVDALTPGLAGLGVDASALMDAVFSWTEGHPYFTQRLCDALRRAGASDVPALARVDALVEKTVPVGNPLGDPAFKSSSDRLLRTGDERERLEALALWRRLLGGEEVDAQATHAAQARLRLAGVAADRGLDGRRLLRVRNRLVGRAFDRAWVSAALGGRMLEDALNRWNDSGRSEDQVLRGRALDDALARTKERDRTADEEAFLRASLDVRSRGQRRRWAVGATVTTAAAVTTVALAAAAYSADKRELAEAALRTAREAEQKAERRKTEAERARQESLETAAVALAQTQGEELAALQNALLAYAGARARGAVSAALEDALITSVTRAAMGMPVAAHRGEVAGACFVRDDARVVSAGGDGAVRAWDPADGSLAETLSAAGGAAMRALACAPGGRWFAAGGDDRRVRVWDASTLALARTLSVDGAVIELAVSDDGSVLVATQGGRMHRWGPTGDVAAEASLAIGRTTGGVRLSVSPDGATALVTGVADEPQRWDLRTMTLAPTPTWRGVVGVRMGRLVPGVAAPRVMWSDATGGVEVVPTTGPWAFERIENGSSVRDLTLDPTGRWFARVREDGTVGGGRTDERRLLWRWSAPGRAQRVAFSTRGRRLVWTDESGALRLAPLTRPPWELRGDHDAPVTALAWCDGGQALVSGDARGALRLWQEGASRSLGAAAGSVRALACGTAGGSAWVLVATDDEVTLRDRVSGTLVRALERGVASATVAVTEDGARYAVARGGVVEVVEVASGARRRIEGIGGPIEALTFERGGEVLVVVAEGTLLRWGRDASPLRRCDGVLRAVRAVTVTDDGHAVVLAGGDGWNQWVDRARCEVQRTVRAHAGSAGAVVAGEAGSVYTAGDDGIVRRWNVERRLAGALWGSVGQVRALSVAGGRVAVGAEDGVVRVWATAAEEYVREGCRMLSRREEAVVVRGVCRGDGG